MQVRLRSAWPNKPFILTAATLNFSMMPPEKGSERFESPGNHTTGGDGKPHRTAAPKHGGCPARRNSGSYGGLCFVSEPLHEAEWSSEWMVPLPPQSARDDDILNPCLRGSERLNPKDSSATLTHADNQGNRQTFQSLNWNGFKCHQQ